MREEYKVLKKYWTTIGGQRVEVSVYEAALPAYVQSRILWREKLRLIQQAIQETYVPWEEETNE